MKEEINKIGEILIQNKEQYIKIKNLDDELFGDSLETIGKGKE